jgi:hypothetical protein
MTVIESQPASFSSSLQVIAGIAARSLARSTMAARPRLSASWTRSRNLLLFEFEVSIASQKYVKSPSSNSSSVIWAKTLRQSKLFTLRTWHAGLLPWVNQGLSVDDTTAPANAGRARVSDEYVGGRKHQLRARIARLSGIGRGDSSWWAKRLCAAVDSGYAREAEWVSSPVCCGSASVILSGESKRALQFQNGEADGREYIRPFGHRDCRFQRRIAGHPKVGIQTCATQDVDSACEQHWATDNHGSAGGKLDAADGAEWDLGRRGVAESGHSDGVFV